jgi:proline iminopeptidase
MEKLRTHLNIDKWLIFGGSWGTTLSLYYGQEYPQHTHGLVLRGIFLASYRENDRFYSAEALANELGGKWDPQSLEAMYKYAEDNSIVTEKSPQGLLDAFYELVLVRNDFKAMHLWSEFEEYVDNPSPIKLTQMLTLPESPDEVSPGIRGHAIFEILFFRSLPNELDLLDPLRLDKIKEIPVHMVQGSQDSVCPKEVAMLLAEKITGAGGRAHLQIIEGEKHTPQTPRMTDALITITDGFKT